MNFYSIGHSNVEIDFFIGLLKRHEILALVDTRSRPYSRFLPHFNQGNLGLALSEAGIEYVYMGDRIGGRPSDPRYYSESGSVDYEMMTTNPAYRSGIDALVALGTRTRTAFMCAEADYHRCHRYWLITRSLLEKRIEVLHITHSGGLARSDVSEFAAEQPNLFREALKGNRAGPGQPSLTPARLIYTIGFTRKSLERFVTLLRSARVTTLVDIRLRNTSQLAGWTKYPDLPFLLTEGFQIGYEHHPELAPTAEILDRYKKDHNWARYEVEFRELLERRSPISQCRNLLNNGTICLLCAEPTAERCHRRLVAEYIRRIQDDLEIKHL